MAKPPSPRPLSIKLISVYFAIAALGLWVALPSELRTGTSFLVMIGLQLTGPVAYCNTIFWTLLTSYVPIGLWRLHNTARWIAMGLCMLTILDTVSKQMKGIVPGVLPFSPLLDYLLMTVIIVFLIRRKSAFVKATDRANNA